MRDEDRILRKLNFMQKCVSYPKSVDAGSSGLENNYELRSAVERNFQLVIESAIDIGEMIISRERFEKPETYRSGYGYSAHVPDRKARGFR
ncbi:DUF86 domain-containing protein [Methanolobus halotolerans]|uniref:DUF86 domain-containing protein n=1 Tax=Methanolobus halotolerans TaxID=2052935 RepID=UPI001F2CFBD9|nr:HepT-like ribonuclease domain-containing protein [Methanolobus halotolerans]